MASKRIVVAGAGPNGLSAAVALARQGHQIELLEANERIGGGAQTAELTLPGFRHDVCSAVHPMGVCSPFFRKLPLARHGLEWVHPPLLAAHPFDDGSAAYLARTTRETGASLGVPDGRSYQRLMDPFVENWQDLLDEALAPPLHLPRRPLLMARLGFFGLAPAATLAEQRFCSDRARAFFLGIAAHTLLPMENSPSAAFGLMLALAGHGGGWPMPRGGSQSISDALASLLRAHGGEIRTRSELRSLAPLGRADALVLNLTPRQVLRVAGDRLPWLYRRQLAAYRYAPGVFKMDWALSGAIPWRAPECRQAGTIHLGATSAEIIASADATWYGRKDENPYVILVQPSLFDRTRCPEGRHTAWAYCHVPCGSIEDKSEAIERQIERFAPGFKELVLARHTFNSRDLEAHNANLVGGDINGGVQDLRQFVFRPVPRLDPYATPVPGLFLCSSSTPPGGAVHGMCGYHAARSVLRYLGEGYAAFAA